MKKFYSIILCAAVVLTTGCAAVSPGEYNLLIEEKTTLKNNNAKLQNEIDDLKSELEALKAEQAEETELELENEELQKKIATREECMCIGVWMLGRPQSSIVDNEVSKYDDNVDLESTIYMEETHFSTKIVHTIKDDLSPVKTAIHIATYEKATFDNIENFLDDDMRELVIIYRNFNEGYGSVIAHSYWYFDDDGVIQRNNFFTVYAQNQGIADEYFKIIDNL